MSVLILADADVRELLDMEGCIEAMRRALVSLARGEVHVPLRPVVRPPDQPTLLGLMPVFRDGDVPLYALKTVVVAPDNPSRGLDPHQGTVTLSDGVTGETLTVINASPVTSIRTAACTAVATDALARADARVLAIVGAGHQARAHVEALLRVRPFEEIRIASRTRRSAEAVAADFDGAQAVASVEEAVRGADVVCTVTSSPEPVLRREWLAPGAHVNAVGACLPTTRELDAATVAASSFFVDRRESAEHEAGDLLLAVAEGAVGLDHVQAEVGEVLLGQHPGRRSPDELTVFESLGVAVEDLFAAEYVLERARAAGRGTTVPF